MAKTHSPLFSASAHGKLARSLVYSKKKSGQLTRSMHYPKKEPSLKQWTRRHIVGLLTAHWQCMTDAEHLTWNTNAAASSLNLPGYQYFLKLAQADLPTHHGLVLYLPFEEATGEGVRCKACNMIMGTLEPSYPDNCPTRLPSFRKEYGNCLSFDGEDDYVILNYAPQLAITTAFTIEAWIKVADLDSGVGVIVANYVTGGDKRCFILRVVNAVLSFYYSADGITADYINAATPLTLEWTHVLVTKGADNKIRYFINAVQDASEADLISLHTEEQDIEVGMRNMADYFIGRMDELRIYNRSLGAAEIKKHFDLLRLNKIRQPLLRL